MRANTRVENYQSPFSVTIPLNKTQEMEVIFRFKTKETKGKESNWGEEFLKIFEPTRKKAGKYSTREINQDIAQTIKKIRSNV